MYSVVSVYLCLCIIIYCKARYLQNQFVDLDFCQIYSRHFLHTTQKMINFCSISHLRWPIFSHFIFFEMIVVTPLANSD